MTKERATLHEFNIYNGALMVRRGYANTAIALAAAKELKAFRGEGTTYLITTRHRIIMNLRDRKTS